MLVLKSGFYKPSENVHEQLDSVANQQSYKIVNQRI